MEVQKTPDDELVVIEQELESQNMSTKILHDRDAAYRVGFVKGVRAVIARLRAEGWVKPKEPTDG